MKISMMGVVAAFSLAAFAEPENVGGVYPSLAYYNEEGECGTGAVVPWAGSLWVVTYGPHCPVGSSDKLYQITPKKEQIIRKESVGGTHADRMIHRESQQLFIGTYLVTKDGKVRTVPIHTMPGRLTGCARHLVDPKNKIYVTDMVVAGTEGLISDSKLCMRFTYAGRVLLAKGVLGAFGRSVASETERIWKSYPGAENIEVGFSQKGYAELKRRAAAAGLRPQAYVEAI